MSASKRRRTSPETTTPYTATHQSHAEPQTTPPKPATEPETTHLDPHGDVLLVLASDNDSTLITAKVLCQSRTLRMASPVLDKLLSAPFKEGTELQAKGYVEITLCDEWPEAALVILKILHFTYDEDGEESEEKAVDVGMLARIACVADKYQCVPALRPWIRVWEKKVDMLEKNNSAYPKIWKDLYIPAILACWWFRRLKPLHGLLARAVMQVNRQGDGGAGLKEHDLEMHLPDGLINTILDGAESLRAYIAVKLDYHMSDVYHDISNVYTLIPETYICTNCGRDADGGKCQRRYCGSAAIIRKYCDGNSRVTNWYLTLRRANIWPTIKIIGQNVPRYISEGPETLTKVIEIMNVLEKDIEAHKCSGEQTCPFKRSWYNMRTEMKCHVEKAIEDVGKRGLCLFETPEKEAGEMLADRETDATREECLHGIVWRSVSAWGFKDRKEISMSE